MTDDEIKLKFDPLGMIKRDLIYIILIIFCLGACAYTLIHVYDKVQEAYNKCDAYIKSDCTCKGQGMLMNNINLSEVMLNVNQS